MSDYLVEFHAEASEDADAAYIWYELQQSGLGERFLKEVWQKIGVIIDAPQLFSSKTRKEYREAKVNDFPYIVVYKIYLRKKIVLISAIHHEKMSPGKKYRK